MSRRTVRGVTSSRPASSAPVHTGRDCSRESSVRRRPGVSALCDVVDRIGDEQWAMGLPAWFKANPAQKDLDLRRIINYHAYDDAWVPDVLAGKTMAEVGSRHDGDLL